MWRKCIRSLYTLLHGKSYSPDADAASDFDEYMGSTSMDCIAVTVRRAPNITVQHWSAGPLRSPGPSPRRFFYSRGMDNWDMALLKVTQDDKETAAPVALVEEHFSLDNTPSCAKGSEPLYLRSTQLRVRRFVSWIAGFRHQGFGHAVLILPLEEIVTVLHAHDLHDFSGLVDFSAPAWTYDAFAVKALPYNLHGNCLPIREVGLVVRTWRWFEGRSGGRCGEY